MESLHQCVPFVSVANTRNGFIAIFCVFEIVKVFVLEHKLSLDTVVGSAEELIENMVVPLAGVQLDHSGLFEQIPIDVRPGNLPRPRKLDANEFSESRRVIIADSLRVAEIFQDWIRTQYLLGQVRSEACWHGPLAECKLTSQECFGFRRHLRVSGKLPQRLQRCVVLYLRDCALDTY